MIPNIWDSGDCDCDYGDCDCDYGDCNCDCGNGITAGAIVRLNKALYRQKQAARLWYKDMDSFLRSLGFTQSHAAHNLYIYGLGPSRVLLLSYTDNISQAYASSAIKAVDNMTPSSRLSTGSQPRTCSPIPRNRDRQRDRQREPR